ncbi:hypothetical protein AXG93_2189s1420 [Marchantia polymorpha subsp. ruderalis]|uniref:Uncharacterized protein n=1 Tax=Marchantia polymorpha subsp. ruderalis TaxID=1480154 RepID=A0A176WQV0_MARPO|nr:hypothetical protein AXG93_2189s1420 [Marchantia polymorpha subsp. ruderalis]
MAQLRTGIMIVAFLIVPFLQTSEALDFLFWDGPTCTGFVQSLCTAISNDTCCIADNAYQSVQVQEGDPCKSATTFKDGDCAANVTVTTTTVPINTSTNGTTDNGTFNGSTPTVRRRALLSTLRGQEAIPERDLTSQARPDHNVIYYREGPTMGIWSLSSGGASKAELLEQLSSVPDEDKVSWLFSHGATYDDAMEGELLEIVEA